MTDPPQHNPEALRRRAVVLRYTADREAAPHVAAKGTGFLADRILEVARENGIPIHSDPNLVAVLSQLDLNTEIPEALYQAVAEVLAFVYRMDQRVEKPRG
ncbi:MAG: EscU/YscU/HrcU family type III secretion system export apparatus switch protein [Candidatus Hydrogenedentota bacterium]